jgi:transposase
LPAPALHAYLKDLLTKLANGHLDKDIDALMPWAYAKQTVTKNELVA